MRARERLCLGLLPLVVAPLVHACSGGAGRGAPTSATGGSVAGAAGTGADPGTGPLTEAECMQLVDHYIDLSMAEKRTTLPAEEVPTAAQVARVRTAMRDEARENCVGLAERERYRCAMKAQTSREVAACLAEQKGG